jgi:predicted AAA+ superfamily ATPase
VLFRERTLAGVLRGGARSFASLVVVGPRQSGKTTLVRRLFGGTHTFCSLDDPSVVGQARADPELLLLRFPPPVILDEIQYAPELLPVIKRDIDERRSVRGRYVMTGSQLFPLMEGVTESLAGRVAVTTLLSFSLREGAGEADVGSSWKEMLEDAATPVARVPTILESILRGGYPEPALNRDMDPRLWHASYVQTYLERDVRTLRAVGDLGDFQRLLAALAARTSNLINFEDLARDLGVTGKTLKAWVSVLETSGQVLSLKPYHVSLGKRLVKRPKVYFLDTGMLAFFLGVTQADQLLAGASAGPLFETAVLGQLHRLFVHRGEPSPLYFWRTAAGHEVDFVIEDGPRLIPIEAKLTATPTSREAAGIETFQKLFGKRAAKGYVVCLCRERFPLTRSVDALPIGAF